MEEVTAEQRVSYAALIDDILKSADLQTISSKKIRAIMTERLNRDLSGQKKAIGEIVNERFDAMNASPEPVLAPTNGHTNGVKRSASASVSLSANGENFEESDPPAKKQKQRKQNDSDNDARLAAKLQAEENSRARPTRGGGAKKIIMKAKKKSKSTPKKKSAAKVKADDDSDMELDSDGEKKERPKSGAFHKEYALSAPLAELVHASQLSRPQVVKKIWEHIKANDLQDPTDKRNIICDDKMFAVFKTDKVHMFTMNKLLGKQLYPLDEA